MDALIRGSRFNVLVHAAGGSSLTDMCIKTWTQWWPMFNECKMQGLPWHMEGGIQRLRETGTLGCHVRPAHWLPGYVQPEPSSGSESGTGEEA